MERLKIIVFVKYKLLSVVNSDLHKVTGLGRLYAIFPFSISELKVR